MGLYDEILIKDNHIVAFSKLYKDISKDIITHIISITKKRKLKNVRIEIEVTNLHQLKEAFTSGVDVVMLDNMKLEDIEEAVRLRDAEGYKALIEVSGGVTLLNLEEIARVKPDFISVGAITHSAKPIDMSLEVI
jgi:nicotinate-nucleotide pyrophosphorylase (carboxylating)